MNGQHILIARQNDDATAWQVALRERGTWNLHGNPVSSLEACVASALAIMEQRGGLPDFTFSSREARAFKDTGVVDDASQLRAAVPGASILVMAPSRPSHDTDLWGRAWRDPTGRLTNLGREVSFRPVTLIEQVRAWFVAENYRSFVPEPARARRDIQRIPRPGCERELWVRHDWTIPGVMAEPATTAA
jgi:hypothetical protein